MNQGDKPDILIYHGPSCLDGFGCVWALSGKWPDVAVHEGVYGRDPPDVTGLRVLIADFSYPEDVMREMAKVATSIVVLDHHRTSKDTFKKLFDEGLIRGEHDETRSGAALTWEYVWGNRHAPKMIEHIQDRDLWKFEIPHTREVTAALASAGHDLDVWTGMARALESGRQMEVINDGAAILRQRDTDMAAVIRAGVRSMIIGGVRVPVCNAPFFWASEIAAAMAKDHPFAATYMDLSDGTRQFSLRSREGGQEVHEIAREYGGGGHPMAAGFTAAPGWEGDIDQEPLEAIPLTPGARIKVREG
jgi:hypothetical protein